MRTLSAALACSTSHRIGPSFAIFPCCHMSTETLQPPCHCRNSAKATTPCWKAGFWAGYTIKTGMGTIGDVRNNVKPNDLERFSLNLWSGKREKKRNRVVVSTRLQWQTSYFVLLSFFIIFSLSIIIFFFSQTVAFLGEQHVICFVWIQKWSKIM